MVQSMTGVDLADRPRARYDGLASGSEDYNADAAVLPFAAASFFTVVSL